MSLGAASWATIGSKRLLNHWNLDATNLNPAHYHRAHPLIHSWRKLSSAGADDALYLPAKCSLRQRHAACLSTCFLDLAQLLWDALSRFVRLLQWLLISSHSCPSGCWLSIRSSHRCRKRRVSSRPTSQLSPTGIEEHKYDCAVPVQ